MHFTSAILTDLEEPSVNLIDMTNIGLIIIIKNQFKNCICFFLNVFA